MRATGISIAITSEMELVDNFCVEFIVLITLSTESTLVIVVAQSLPSVGKHFTLSTVIAQVENTSAPTTLVAIFLHPSPHLFLKKQRSIILAESDV